MNKKNVLGLGLVGLLSPSVVNAESGVVAPNYIIPVETDWNHFVDKARELGYGIMVVPLRNGSPSYVLWDVAEAVRGKDYYLVNGVGAEWNVTMCDSENTRGEVVGINNRIADASAEVARLVGMNSYARALLSDYQAVVIKDRVCSSTDVVRQRDGVKGDGFKVVRSEVPNYELVWVAIKPEDMPVRECSAPESVVPEPAPEPAPAPAPAPVALEGPKLKFLPRGSSQWDLGYRRLGFNGGRSGISYFVEHVSDELNVTEDGEIDWYLNPNVTLPIIGTADEKWMLFVDYDGRFSNVNPGTIDGTERSHFIGGGLQFANDKYGFGAVLGGMLYDRTTNSRDGDVTTTTEQAGNGFGARVLFRAPWMLIGYDYERLPSLDLIVDGSIEGYGEFSANASADVMKHRLYGGFLLTKGELSANPYGFVDATSVLVDGSEIVPDQWNRQFSPGVGLDLRYSPFEHWTFGLNAEGSLFKSVETPVEDQIIRGSGSNVSLGITYRP